MMIKTYLISDGGGEGREEGGVRVRQDPWIAWRR